MTLDIINNPEPPKEEIAVTTDGYRCKYCGAENSGIAHYTETGFGVADILSLTEWHGRPELDNYELTDTDNFDISDYACSNCGEERGNLTDIFEPIPEQEEEEDV